MSMSGKNKQERGLANEHFESLKALRDHLVEDRRGLVTSILADLQSTGDTAGEFVGLQHFIDAVERALSHESVLSRPDTKMPPRPMR